MSSVFNLSIGNACNLRCSFCYNDFNRNQKQGFFDFHTIIKIVLKLKKDKIERVTLIGGEPTLYPSFFKLIKYLKKNKIKITLVTNGVTLSDKDFLNKIIKTNSIDEYIISFHSASENIEKKISKRVGVYNKKILGIKNVLQNNLNLSINLVINNYNINYINIIVDKLIILGLKNIRIYNMIINGKTSERNMNSLPNFSLLLNNLNKINRIYLDYLEFHWFPICIFKGFSHNIKLREFNKNYIGNVFLDGKNILNRLKIDKIKLKQCDKCYVYEKQCFGPFKNYVKVFGSDFFTALNKKDFLKIKNYHIKNKKLCY